MNVILFSLYCLLSYLSLVMLSFLLCGCHLVFLLLSFVTLNTCYVKFLLCECQLVFPLLSFVILITCYVKYAPMWMSSCFPSIFFCNTYHLLCWVCSYVDVILSSFYCLLSHLTLVTLSLLLCECQLVFPLLSFVILITCYVKYAPMWMSSCLPSIFFLSYLSLVMLSLLLCECHLVFPLLPFVILITCYVKFVSYVNVILFFPLLFFVILIICYVKFAPMWMSSCFPSIAFCHTYHLLCYVFSYVNVILSYFSCLLSYLSLVMLSLFQCEGHLVFPLLSFVILITCYVKFAPMWMSSCFPSIVFCHTYHLLR